MGNIFDNISKLCEQQYISIYRLEKQAGIGNGVIARWKTSSPTVENLMSVADALGVDITELLKGNANPQDGR